MWGRFQAIANSQDFPVLGVIALGGALGALARFGLGHVWPHVPGTVPWSTLVINVVGCFLIGVLMVVITEVRVAHRLVRPFFGVGILGGFTTFSTYSVEIHGLLDDHEYVVAFGYMFGTVALALAAVVVGVAITRMSTGVTVWRRSANG